MGIDLKDNIALLCNVFGVYPASPFTLLQPHILTLNCQSLPSPSTLMSSISSRSLVSSPTPASSTTLLPTLLAPVAASVASTPASGKLPKTRASPGDNRKKRCIESDEKENDIFETPSDTVDANTEPEIDIFTTPAKTHEQSIPTAHTDSDSIFAYPAFASHEADPLDDSVSETSIVSEHDQSCPLDTDGILPSENDGNSHFHQSQEDTANAPGHLRKAPTIQEAEAALKDINKVLHPP
ncbi:hypothetical protein BT96DRAFT_1007797 [Gymnopus androsaceus JB14]|uniref:Uncharacterized protein n=1 Tax=Gymnopus androsaceus JB14 TaxID=1447944 RepID=A0A6A4GGS2_9AGAR|nr:hypothetical protein BT96DRAFT_1007797 [Gymnopus androsaceus JB14]